MPQVTISVDSARTTLVATGKVATAHEWTDGKRSEAQKRDRDTGMPVWIVDAILDDPNARSAVTAGFEVPALDEPKVTAWRPVEVKGLRVTIYVDKGGRIAMRWAADELVEHSVSRPSAVAS